jgi:hypothetical protein
MTLFISQKNQTLLWNVINKNETINNYFMFHPKKEEWFKSILGFFYEKNYNRNLSKDDLLQLNKETIAYMLQTIKLNTNKQGNEHESSTDMQQKEITPTNFLKSYSVTENKVEKIGNQYSNKQVEYNSLLEKRVPDAINFVEKHDTPLENMDELIKRHLKEREDEIGKFNYPPLRAEEQIPNRLTIIDDSDTIQIQIEEIEGKPKEKKTVSWLDAENYEKHQKDFELLKETVKELMEKINNLEKIISSK